MDLFWYSLKISISSICFQMIMIACCCNPNFCFFHGSYLLNFKNSLKIQQFNFLMSLKIWIKLQYIIEILIEVSFCFFIKEHSAICFHDEVFFKDKSRNFRFFRIVIPFVSSMIRLCLHSYLVKGALQRFHHLMLDIFYKFRKKAFFMI